MIVFYFVLQSYRKPRPPVACPSRPPAGWRCAAHVAAPDARRRRPPKPPGAAAAASGPWGGRHPHGPAGASSCPPGAPNRTSPGAEKRLSKGFKRDSKAFKGLQRHVT